MYRSLRTLLGTTALLGATVAISGCENKETVLDMKTPDGGMQIERDKDNGEITIEVDKD